MGNKLSQQNSLTSTLCWVSWEPPDWGMILGSGNHLVNQDSKFGEREKVGSGLFREKLEEEM
jgi:hypothetical protein